jgi:hypothetical protein
VAAFGLPGLSEKVVTHLAKINKPHSGRVTPHEIQNFSQGRHGQMVSILIPDVKACGVISGKVLTIPKNHDFPEGTPDRLPPHHINHPGQKYIAHLDAKRPRDGSEPQNGLGGTRSPDAAHAASPD